MSNPRTTFVLGSVLGFLLGAVLAGAGVWWFGFASGVMNGATAVGAPTPSATRPANQPPAAPTASAPAPAKPAGGPSDIIVSLSEPFLNDQFQKSVPPDSPLQPGAELKVGDGGQVIIDGKVTVSVGPLKPTVPVRARVGTQAVDGRLALNLDKVEVGPLPIPQQLIPEAVKSVLPAVERQLNGFLENNNTLREMKIMSARSDKGRYVLELDDGR